MSVGTNETTVNDLITKVVEGERTTLKLAEALEGQDGKRLVIEHQKLPPERAEEPRRKESPPRAHVFYAVAGFLDYLDAYGGSETVLYADPEEGTVTAVLDEIADKGYELVVLRPMFHPRWAPWQGLLGRTLLLQEFVDFLRDNRRAVVGPEDGKALVLALSQIRASTHVELHVGSGANKRRGDLGGALNGILIKSKIQGGEESQLVELPEELVVETPIYVDMDPVRVEVDLTLDVSKDGTAVTARLATADLREAMIQAFDGIVNECRERRVDDAALDRVTYGSPVYGSWAYLDTVR